MKYFITLTLIAAFSLPALAQEKARERAGEIKAWREQCSHPDPDLRLAYLEAALELDDASIERICVRLALQSDNADIRNLGLRAAIASFEQLTFDVEIPPQLAAAIEEGKDVHDWYIARDYTHIRNGVTFEIKKADVTKGQSIWFPFGSRSNAHDSYQGMATVVGETIRWTGSMYLAREWPCTLDVTLNDQGRLEGEMQCSNHWPYPVSASLL